MAFVAKLIYNKKSSQVITTLPKKQIPALLHLRKKGLPIREPTWIRVKDYDLIYEGEY